MAKKRKGKTLADFALNSDDPSVYAKVAGNTLSGLISKASLMANKRTDLSDEIDVTRALSQRSVAILGALMDSETAKEDTKGAAATLVDNAIKTVATIVEKQAKITALEEGMIRLTSVEWILAQITQILHDSLGEGVVLDKIVDKIKKIRVPMDDSLESFMENTARTEEFL